MSYRFPQRVEILFGQFYAQGHRLTLRGNYMLYSGAPGRTCHEVAKAARDYLVEKGLECRGRIGYSNGIEWSQANVLSIEPNNPTILVPGHIFHCIPIVYLPG